MGDVVFLNFVLSGKPSFSPQIVVTDLKIQMSDTDPVLTFLAVTGNFRAGSVLMGASLRKKLGYLYAKLKFRTFSKHLNRSYYCKADRLPE